MNDPNPPYAFRGPFGRKNVEIAVSTRSTPIAEIPGPIANEIPITELPLAGPLQGDEQVALVQNGVTTRAMLSATAQPGLPGPSGAQGPPGPQGPQGPPGAALVSPGLTPPVSPTPGALWFDTSAAQMYLWFDDGSSQQWVPIVNQLSVGGAGPTPPSAPVNTAPPVVTGTATAGSTLTTTDGSWTPAPTSFAYQWKRNGANISGATANSYLLTGADASTTVNCTVTAFNGLNSASASSNSISVLPTAPVNSVPPVISGTTSLGSTLTVTSNGTWSGGPTFTYQWQRGVTNISGANTSTYVVAAPDLGTSVSCVVTATNVAGSASVGSNALVVPVFPATPVALFSLRNVGTGYAGPCLKVRRTSDSTQLDIGFNPTTGVIDMAAANTFAAGSLLYVTKWYDQSSNALHVVQVNPGAEPLLATINGRPWLSFQASVGSILQSAAVGTFALAGDQTIGAVTQLNSDNGQVPMGCIDGSDGWAFFYNGVAGGPGPNPGKNVYYATKAGSGAQIAGTFDMFTKMPTRMVTTRASGALKIYANGTLGGSGTVAGTNIGTSTEVFKIGTYAHFGLNFEGLIGEVYLYSSALTDPVRLAIDANQAAAFPDTGFLPPYNGTAAVQFGFNQQISFGNILNYERTQPWTAWSAIQMYGVSPPAVAGGIVFSNVTAPSDPTFPGYEMWVDKQGFLRVRVIHDASVFNMIGLIGSVFLADGKQHMVAATYDGSSLIAGIKMYIDGVLDTAAFGEGSFLTASIIKTGQAMLVGTQQNEGSFNFTGTIGHLQLDNVVRNAAYIAPIKNGVLPPQNANTVWRLLFNEGTGTLVHDTSGASLNGTLTSGNMWVP